MCFIIPQNILQNIIKNGDAEQKGFATSMLSNVFNFESSLLNRLPFAPESKGNEGAVGEWIDDLFGAGKEKGKDREVYDAENKMRLPGKLILKENNGKSSDESVNAAYQYAGITYDMFKNLFGRNSIDNKGMTLKSVVNYGKGFANAFWNSELMVFGSGDGRIFENFLLLDIASHEMSHGCTEHSANLDYYSMSGSLNEHFSDAFGIIAKQYHLNQKAEESNWLLGEGLFTKNVQARALRDLMNPGTAYDDPVIGKDRQTKHIDEYDNSPEDNQMVHCNSGIFNRIFANVAVNLGGYSWEKAGKIWYSALTTKLRSKSNFQDAANALTLCAGELYGKNSHEQKVVIDGCKLVGIKPAL